MPTTTKNAALWVYDGTKWVRVNPDAMGSAPAVHSHTVMDITDISKVGVTNDYNDLSNLPPPAATKTSELTNDSDFVTKAQAVAASPVQSIIGGTGIAVANDGAGHYTIANTGGGAGGASGTVTSVSGRAPIVVANGTTTPSISVADASIASAGVVRLATDADITAGTAGRVPTAVQLKAVKDAAVQVQADWAATSGMASIANKPTLAAVATTGSYNDLANKPAIPTVPTKLSGFTNDLGFVNTAQAKAAAPVQSIAAGPNVSIVDNGGGALTISATLNAVQSDWNATTGAAAILNRPTLKTVATSGSYNDLLDRPTIPAAQVQTDWNAISGMGLILNKPTLAAVATTGDYSSLTGRPTLAKVAGTGVYTDLTGLPTIPAAQVQSDWNAASGMGKILNKPNLATVATTGSYNDLTDKPTTINVADATTTTKGIVQLANPAAITAGTAGLVVTADQLKLVKDGAALATHTHTAGQVTGLALVATTGKFSDLTQTPIIPTKVSDLLNDRAFVDAAGAKAAAPIQKIIAGANVSISDDGAGGITVASTGTGGGGTSSGITAVSGTAPIQVADGTTAPKVSVAEATTAAAGVARLADATAITLGTAGRVVDAAQLKAVKDGAAAASHTHPAAQVTGLAAIATSGSWADIVGGPTASIVPGYDLAATASAGTAVNYARADHTHKLPTAAQVGAAAATHTHTAAQVDGLKNLASKGDLLTHDGATIVRKTVGTAGQVLTVGSDGNVGWVTPVSGATASTAPGADLASAAAVGTSNAYARADHVHKLPTLTALGAAAATHTHAPADITGLATVATTGAYSDLTGAPAVPAPAGTAPADLAATAAAGTASTYSRSDHVHKLPTLTELGVVGTYARKAGDTFTGAVNINYATARFAITGTGGIVQTISSTDGGAAAINFTSGTASGQFNQTANNFTFTNYASGGITTINQVGAGTLRFYVNSILALSSTGAATTIAGNITASGTAHTFAAGSIQASAISGLAAAVAGDFVNVSGDSMTGALAISAPDAVPLTVASASANCGVDLSPTGGKKALLSAGATEFALSYDGVKKVAVNSSLVTISDQVFISGATDYSHPTQKGCLTITRTGNGKALYCTGGIEASALLVSAGITSTGAVNKLTNNGATAGTVLIVEGTMNAGVARHDCLGVKVTGIDTGTANGMVVQCLGKATNGAGVWAIVSAASTGGNVGFDAAVTNTAGTSIGFRSSVAAATGNFDFYSGGGANNHFAGRVGIGVGNTAPTAPLHVLGQKIRLSSPKTPASQTDTGDQGDICWDSQYLYLAIGTNQWRRIPFTDWQGNTLPGSGAGATDTALPADFTGGTGVVVGAYTSPNAVGDANAPAAFGRIYMNMGTVIPPLAIGIKVQYRIHGGNWQDATNASYHQKDKPDAGNPFMWQPKATFADLKGPGVSARAVVINGPPAGTPYITRMAWVSTLGTGVWSGEYTAVTPTA